MTLRVGIVSAAWGGFAHLPAWRALPGVEVTAICTSRRESAEAASQRLNIARPFWDAAEMCADPAIDIVDLGTRPAVRLPMILAALEHGKHVYNASPHAPDWAGAKAIDAAWRAGSSVGVVDAFLEYVPALRQMASLIALGHIGRIFGGTCHFNISLFNRPNKQFPYNWFADGRAGVSAMRNNGSHALYLLRQMFGEVAELTADDKQVLTEWRFPDGDVIRPETTDFGNAILRFANGPVIQLQASWSLPVHDGFLLDIYGEQGRLVAKSPTFPTARDCTLEGARLGGTLEPIAIPDCFLTHEDIALDWQAEVQPSFPMALSMFEMIEAIGERGDGSPGFDDALEVERIQEAIRVSNIERRWVQVAEVT